MKKRSLFMIAASLFLAACGSSPGDYRAAGGSLALNIRDVGGFTPGIEHYRAEKYIVTVEGDGISEAIRAEFDGEASEGFIDGVPIGENRTVEVEAFNANGIRIKRGIAGDVAVGGTTAEVDVEMNYIPIFANIADGATVENTRFLIKVIADPANPFIIIGEPRDGESKQSFSISDEPSSNDAFYSDDVSWSVGITPPVMAPGNYGIAVVDSATGLNSRVEIKIVEGRYVKPAPIVSSAGLKENYEAAVDCLSGSLRMEDFR